MTGDRNAERGGSNECDTAGGEAAVLRASGWPWPRSEDLGQYNVYGTKEGHIRLQGCLTSLLTVLSL